MPRITSVRYAFDIARVRINRSESRDYSRSKRSLNRLHTVSKQIGRRIICYDLRWSSCAVAAQRRATATHHNFSHERYSSSRASSSGLCDIFLGGLLKVHATNLLRFARSRTTWADRPLAAQARSSGALTRSSSPCVDRRIHLLRPSSPLHNATKVDEGHSNLRAFKPQLPLKRIKDS